MGTWKFFAMLSCINYLLMLMTTPKEGWAVTINGIELGWPQLVLAIISAAFAVILLWREEQ